MFVAGHAAAGALIGQQLGANPVLIFVLAFISHLLLDVIPHGDHHNVENYFNGRKDKMKSLYNTIIIDSIATVILVSILMQFNQFNRTAMAWGIAGGVIPDLLVGISESMKSKKLKWFSNFHFWFHNALVHQIKVRPIPGMIGQVIAITIMLAAIR